MDPYQFSQKERDQESGLNFFEARYQSPVLGRFLRVDPLAADLKSAWLEEPQRLNLYAYGANSPFGQVDPNGTDLLDAYAGFASGLGEAVLDAIPKSPDPVTVTVTATVALAKTLEAKGNQLGDVAWATFPDVKHTPY